MCRSGEVLQGLIKPHECAAFGKQCTPRNPLGATMVSSEGACAAYYLYRRLQVSGGGRPLAEPALDFEGWTCPVPLRDSPTIVMGHGGGGQLSAELVEHLFVPAFGASPSRPRRLGGRDARRRPHGVLHRHLRGAAAVLPGRVDRAPGGERDGQRPGDERRRRRAPVVRVRPRGGHRTVRGRPRRRRTSVRPLATAGVAVVTGDTKVVDAGHGDQVYVNTAGIGVGAGRRRHPSRPCAAGRRGHRQRRDRRARHRDHERARGHRSSARKMRTDTRGADPARAGDARA